LRLFVGDSTTSAPATRFPLTFASVSVNPYIEMPEGSYRFQVGAIGCTVLSDGYYSYPTPWFFPNAEPDDLSRRWPAAIFP